MPRPRIHADANARKRASKARRRQAETSPDVAVTSPAQALRGDETEEPSLESLKDLSRSELRRILQSPTELGQTKVAAARVVGQLDARELDADDREVALWLAQRATIETLPEKDRMTFLLEWRRALIACEEAS